jgi:hypothetical protein
LLFEVGHLQKVFFKSKILNKIMLKERKKNSKFFRKKCLSFFFDKKKLLKFFKLKSESDKKNLIVRKILLWLIGRRSVSWTEDGL